MSSTNRSNIRNNHKHDYYVTPVDDILKFLRVFEKNNKNIIKKSKILDCCAGGHGIIQMSYPKAFEYYDKNVDTIDIRKDSLAEIKEDYMCIDCKNRYDIIITNPPFFIAHEIISKALDDVKYNGYVIMLLRLNYFGSKKRQEFWKKNPPHSIYIHTERICFTENRKTDSIEYMHCVWKKTENLIWGDSKTYLIF